MTKKLSVMLKVASFIVTVVAALLGVVLPVINVRLDVSNQSTCRPIPQARWKWYQICPCSRDLVKFS